MAMTHGQKIRSEMTARLTEGMEPETAAVYQVLIDLVLSVGVSAFLTMVFRVISAKAHAEIRIPDPKTAGL